MGLLDDLQMGFGLKERTEDYDARTARTIAANERAASRGRAGDVMALAQARNPQHSSFLPVSRSRGAQQYLGSRGYDEGYTPQVAEDDRPFMQRLLFSPESERSRTPYAIGPLTMDQPLPSFGLLGLLSGFGGMLGGLGGEEDVSTRSVVRPMLRPEGFTPYMPSGEPETTFTEDFSDVDVYDPATDYIAPDFSETVPATTAGKEFAENVDFLDTVQSAIDTAEAGIAPPLSNANFYDPSGAYGMRSGTSSIRRMPNGRFVDTLTGKIIF
jgi:hypothetical protein